MNIPSLFRKGSELQTLVENRTSYSLDHAELNLFETHQKAEEVLLDFSQPTLATMLQGKKVMKLRNNDPFPFLPGESIVLPSNELMNINFPEATEDNPTRCLAMVISNEKIKRVTEYMNERMPKESGEEWQFYQKNIHFTNDWGVNQILNRLIFLFTENHPNKNMFVDMALQELLIRILQTETTQSYLDQDSNNDKKESRIASIVNYIRQNIQEKMTVKDLSKKAYMSESTFYRAFKNELGVTPVDFINNLRLKMASALLRDSKKSIREIYMQCGFNSLSYFHRMFKKQFSMTPSDYQRKVNKAT